MKYCIKCRTKDPNFYYCSKCGNVMRELLIEDEGEVFVKLREDDNVSGAGFHVGCCGFVDMFASSLIQKKVFACKKCYLRIVKVN